MGKHRSHRTPTCKRCGHEHYNFQRCAGVEAPSPLDHENVTAPAEVIHRHDIERRPTWGDLTAGSFAATGSFGSGPRFQGASA